MQGLPTDPTLDPRAREHAVKLGLLSAALVQQDDDLAQRLIGEMRVDGVRRATLLEITLQSYLHDGYATALEGVALLNSCWPEAHPAPEMPYSEWEQWKQRGEELFGRIYGSVAEKVRASVRAASPDLAEWMLVEGYGKVLARPGVDSATREICTVAVLVMKNRPRQLYSHLRGALRVGVERDELDALLHAIESSLVLDSRTASARHLLLDLE